MKTTNKVSSLAATLITIGSLVGGVNAATLMTDITDSGNVTITVSGVGQTSTVLDNNGAFWYFELQSGLFRGRANAGVGTPEYGFDYYSQGIDINDMATNYRVSQANGFHVDGINYLMLDVDGNGTHETVLETTVLSFDASAATINRYVFNDDNANLEVSEALTLFNSATNQSVVPEPSSTLLFGLGAFGLLARRKRTV